MQQLQLFTVRLLVVLALIIMAFFLFWFFQPERKGVSWIYWLLTTALLFKLFRWLHEWYHYVSVSYPEPPKTQQEKVWTVDILTTYCPGEPYDMVVDTLKAMTEITYPHTTYLCDEGDDDYLKQVCRELGVVHVTRKEKINAKAGNINNALKQATGEICVVLDPDHKPVRSFLDVVLPYFNDKEIGFVQVVQAYGNHDESFVAKGAAEQTYQFYGPLMMGMSSYGTAQAIGANCTFRRAALDSIGGHAAGLSEDMHTAMRLHAEGWKSVYVPEVLTIGLVPSTLSAYYQQQLKWSRGTFELLFTSYIELFRKFTWRQKIHYFTIALYFLSGLITLFDIVIPVAALVFCIPVWKISMNEFIIMFVPLMMMALIIRTFAQRWLARKHERGLHIAGGVLRMATWWIFLLGFFCTLLRVKIPYIPTPKNDEPRNDWKLCLPNIITAAICLAAVPVGLMLDWTPFAFFMAAFSILNAILLLTVSVLAQQKLLISINKSIRKLKALYSMFKKTTASANWGIDKITGLMRKTALLPGALVFLFAFGNQIRYQFTEPQYNLEEIQPPVQKNTGGFYTGIYIPEIEKSASFEKLSQTEKALNTSFDIVSIYMAWGPESGAVFPDSLMKEITKRNAIPMLTWEPWTWPFPEYRNHEELCCEKKVLQYITKGYFDAYLSDYAKRIKAVDGPVMIRFAHEFDNPAYPWSTAGGNSPEDFIQSWRYVVNYFDSIGVGNVSWVWNPWEEDELEKYYPGDAYVDWIGVTNLNYGKAASNNTWYDSEDLYRPFSEKLKKYNKPVMLSEFGSTTFGGDQSKWFANAFEKIKNDFPEIKALIFFYNNKDPNWGFTSWRPADSSKTIDWTFVSAKTLETVKSYLGQPYFNNHPLKTGKVNFDNKPTKLSSSAIQGDSGTFKLLVQGKPFYIKGVVYNGGSDWRDGNIPLTRNKLENDFQKIKEMGANTIRRYEPSIYDRNIFNVAEENGLKVLYGFWFEQGADYSSNEKLIKEYTEKVEKYVSLYKNEPSILGWTIGNEVWGLSKQYYAQPYLFRVRENYVQFIENLAQRIHAIDPSRPVFISEEHSAKLPAAIEAFKRAPSVDVFAVNSYYHKHIKRLQSEIQLHDPHRPYLVSEFGPEGYWQPDFTKHDNYGAVLEDGGVRKAHLYKRRWLDFVAPFKGSNVGGVAYCWSDRLEGTATWFGITDNKDRLKPSYCALKEVWTETKCASDLNEAYIFSPEEALEPGTEYTFFAVTENSTAQNLTYEWYLCKDEFVIMKEKVKTEDGGRQAKVTIPNVPSNYRLYVNISKEKNYCNTASFPLPAFRGLNTKAK